jgi:hypothetical protein
MLFSLGPDGAIKQTAEVMILRYLIMLREQTRLRSSDQTRTA